jgi:hypothetical protein
MPAAEVEAIPGSHKVLVRDKAWRSAVTDEEELLAMLPVGCVVCVVIAMRQCPA